MEEEKQGVSFGDILHVLRKRLWWVIGVTLIIGIIGTLLIQFVYNKNEKTYTFSFDIEFPGIEDNVYPDGTTFRIADVISIDNLNAIKKSGDYDSVNVAEIIKNNDISLTMVKVSTDEDAKDEKLTSYQYNIVVPAKYFEDSEQATNFLKAATATVVIKVNNIVSTMQYESNLRAFNSCVTSYNEKISYLTAQKNYIIEMYDELIELCQGGYKVVSDSLGTKSGSSLDELRLEVSNIFSTNDYNFVTSTINTKYYVIRNESFNYLDYAETQIKSLAIKYADNAEAIDDNEKALQEVVALYTSTPDTLAQQESVFQSNIATLSSSNSNIKKQIRTYLEEIAQLSDTEANKTAAFTSIKNTTKNADLKAYIESYISGLSISAVDTAEQDAFDAKLNEYATKLSAATETCKLVRTAVYAEKSEIEYTTYNVVADGGLNIFLGILISLVVGFIVIAIIVCLVDLPKYLREKETVAVVAAPAQEEKKDEENK